MELIGDLKPVLKQLLKEGYRVYSYEPSYGDYNSLFWFENGRVLSIQGDPILGYKIFTSYVPSREHGSMSALSGKFNAYELLRFRRVQVPIKGIVNYDSIEHLMGKIDVFVWTEMTTDYVKGQAK